MEGKDMGCSWFCKIEGCEGIDCETTTLSFVLVGMVFVSVGVVGTVLMLSILAL